MRTGSVERLQFATALPSCHTAEADVGANDRLAPHRLEAVRELGRLGLQKLAPRRRVEEELAHLDRSCRRPRAAGCSSPVRASSRVACGGVGGAAGERQLGDRGDRRQRLAAKAERRHAFELGERGDLAGGVAAQRQRQLGGGDAVAVVLDADRPHAAADQADDDLPGAGVDARCRAARARTDAGRSTTSPAAIWLISSPGNSRIGRRMRASMTAFIAAL